jgi:hypothetical protein
MIPILEQYIH